jgi:hypothetical protein
MSKPSPARGSIWSVPEVSPKTLAFVLSEAAGLSRGRPEYTVIPLYPSASTGPHSALDFIISREETTLGEPLFAALWNARPIPAEALGQKVGESISDSLLTEVRDAYLRIADPSVTVRPGRLGDARSGTMERARRDAERALWQPLTGRALSPSADPDTSVFDVALANVGQYGKSFRISLNRYSEGNLCAWPGGTGEFLAVFDPTQYPDVHSIAGNWSYSAFGTRYIEETLNQVVHASFIHYLDAAQYNIRGNLGDIGHGDRHVGDLLTFNLPIKVGDRAETPVKTAQRGGLYAAAS